MPGFLYTTLRPAMYHGHAKKPPFFEGWYYKLVSADEAHRYAIIPGVILGDNAHAFIQVLNGSTGDSAYHQFPIDVFQASRKSFAIEIGDNSFTQDRIQVDIDSDAGSLKGELHFDQTIPWPVTIISPGIMGWYAWVPGMECYHGVLSFDHRIEGSLSLDGESLDFSGGRGYIEKDWGQSFPAAWVWFQTNHFDLPGTCLTASIAIIPWLGNAFRGFIIGLWHAGELFRFATYTGAKTTHLTISDSQVAWIVQDNRYRLELLANRSEGGLILGPTRLEMGKRVNETLKSTVDVRLTARDGRVIFEGIGRHAGLEVHGELDRLLQFRR